jgi:hypothetical protein
MTKWMLTEGICRLAHSGMTNALHHFDEEVLVTQFVDIVEVLLLPSHVLYFAVDPF